MELVLEEDSPLASYLEGKGTSRSECSDSSPSFQTPLPYFPFVPPRQAHPIRFHVQSRQPTPQCWYRSLRSNVQDYYARIVSSTLGKADNERFLEHFRYIIIASQLLNEHVGAFSHTSSEQSSSSPSLNPGTIFGALVSTVLAFGLVCSIQWTRDANSSSLRTTRILIVFIIQSLVALSLYAYVRRHWLKFLRSQAVEAATKFVHEMQSFESSSASIVKQIQEIEIVSRGYQISSPLAPISRLESGEKPRTCQRLRRSLQDVYVSAISAFSDAIDDLGHHVTEDDFDRFLEIYGMHAEDGHAAQATSEEIELGEQQSLAYLRELQYRLSALRRIFLCSLLSIPATGRKEDRVRWRISVARMASLGALLGASSETIAKLVLDEENMPPPSPMIGNGRLTSVYNPNLAAYILQLRTLHAKLHLVRSDVGRMTATSTSALSDPGLRAAFDAVGKDLRASLQMWEQGRAALEDVLTDRRKQFNLNIGGLGVDLRLPEDPVEVSGGSNEALRPLTGGLPASPPLSAHSGSGDESQFLRMNVRTPQSENEVFEAVSLSRKRPVLNREQRIMKMQEDRERAAKTKEKREASTNMIRELQAVINLRPSAHRKSSPQRDMTR